MQSIRQQVREFMIAAGQDVHDKPRIPTNPEIRLRLRLIAEEFQELLSACYADVQDDNLDTIRETLNFMLADDQDPYEDIDIDLVADCFADIDYVVEGARQVFGINGTRVAAEVHAANMRKFAKGCWKRADGKHMKPPNWTGPRIGKVLETQNDFKPELPTQEQRLMYYVRGFEVRIGSMDRFEKIAEAFTGPAPEDSPYRELVDAIIDNARLPIDYIEVLEHQVLVHHRNNFETSIYEVP